MKLPESFSRTTLGLFKALRLVDLAAMIPELLFKLSVLRVMLPPVETRPEVISELVGLVF